MNDEGFRRWLAHNYQPNTVSTKMSEARQLDRAYGDLDAHYDADHLDAIMETLRYSASDKAQGRPNPSKVQMVSDLYRDLSNLRTTINYYRSFRGQRGATRPDADAVNKAIDECAAIGVDIFLETYGFGKSIDYWVLRDGKRYPSKAIFGVAHQYMPDGAPLDGANSNGTTARKYLDKLGFEIVKGDDSQSKTRLFVLYDAQGAAFQPVRHGGPNGSMFKVKPKSARNKPEDVIEMETVTEVARAMLVESLSARVQSLNKGLVNYRAYNTQDLVAYKLDPTIADEVGLPSTGNVEQYNAQLGEKHNIMPVTTNLILYGPPGTGKTWSTATEAVRLCDGDVPEAREELMRRYHELVDARRIDFVTFHQSYSYEEFVEGLRPQQASEYGDGDQTGAGFSLVPEPGIFRRIAHRAAASRGGHGVFDIGERQVFKLSIGEAANAEDDYLFEEALEKEHILLGYDDIDWSDEKFDSREEIIAACRAYDDENPGSHRLSPTAQTGRVQCPLIFRNWIKTGDIVVVSKGNSKFRAIGEVSGEYEYAPRDSGVYAHRRKVKWLWIDKDGAPVEDIYSKRFSMRAVYVLAHAELNFPALEGYIKGQSQEGAAAVPEPYVLIIDEINRGNISKIFGELITLIEPDKRAGSANAIEVRLPYSKNPFTLPPNLHIIGTMNTADRSIALLDTALRRRFIFRETPPEPKHLGENVDGVPLRRVLETINDRIEYLVDREHRVGHAFFLGCATRGEIDVVMRDKIIPLIQEYFFEDWGRLAAVLGGVRGNGFLECRMLKDPTDKDGEDRESWSVRSTFTEDAYIRLIGAGPNISTKVAEAG